MISFISLYQDLPFLLFEEKYNLAVKKKQRNANAAAISSYDIETGEVDSRFVNINEVNKNKFIFYTNYNSPKSSQFKNHSQISVLFYWSNTNTQIRIKGDISKLKDSQSDNYFYKRDRYKNALAICSKQSEVLESYEMLEKNYKHTIEKNDLRERPNYWGGYSIKPYSIEFWSGHEKRLNKRESYRLIENEWQKNYLWP